MKPINCPRCKQQSLQVLVTVPAVDLTFNNCAITGNVECRSIQFCGPEKATCTECGVEYDVDTLNYLERVEK